jgi:ACR3 family arsenite transporter
MKEAGMKEPGMKEAGVKERGMKEKERSEQSGNAGGIGLFEKTLSLWVLGCMVAGILIGKFLPAIPDFLGKFEVANVSIPIAILIWLMIYPMMLKVDFASIRKVGENPRDCT